MTPPGSRGSAQFRFYLDEDVPQLAAEIGRGLGLDILGAREVGLLAQPDAVHLSAAATDGRILVTYNRNDFIECTRDAFATGRPHAGVIILTHKLPRDAARVAHTIHRWAEGAPKTIGPPPLQAYAIIFLSA